MKRYSIILLIAMLGSCSKTPSTVNATYILSDSASYSAFGPLDSVISMQIIAGSKIIYNDSTWNYIGGEYFNGLNYIFLFEPNNDSIYIMYPDTASSANSVIYRGYRKI